MTRITVTLDNALTTMPVKAFLKAQQGISNTIWKRIKNSGTFAINGEICIAARATVKTGDIITYDILRPSDVIPEDIPLEVLYEDEYLLIVNKPAGQLVHPVPKENTGTLGNAVLHWYIKHGENHAFHPVHRLDRDTSGL
ncbi:MAG: RluA family pseudouridine synthase, partial [Selenomonas sp.]|nr:RluA family pseudouridine synthase [Selenomonas sp.]